VGDIGSDTYNSLLADGSSKLKCMPDCSPGPPRIS
jgi:hypothetical protein